MKSTQSLKLHLLSAAVASTLCAPHASAVDLFQDPWSCTGVCGVATSEIGASASSTYGFVTTTGSSGAASLGQGGEANGSRVLSSSFSAVKDETLSFSFNYVTTDSKEFTDYGWARVIDTKGTTLTSDDSTAAWLFTARSSSKGGAVVPGDLVPSNYFSNHTDGVTLTIPADFNEMRQAPEWDPLGGSSGTCFENKKECGYTGWLGSTITFANSGTYALEFGVTNVGDPFFNSGLAFRFEGVDKAQLESIASHAPEPSNFALMATGLALFGLHASRRRRRD